jgi:hypothetical protein
MKLYHGDRFLGDISPVGVEGVWMSGEIKLSPVAADYRSFFEFMTDETGGAEDPPFGESLLDPENWYVLDKGQKRGIEVPAVHPDGSIDWRWR